MYKLSTILLSLFSNNSAISKIIFNLYYTFIITFLIGSVPIFNNHRRSDIALLILWPLKYTKDVNTKKEPTQRLSNQIYIFMFFISIRIAFVIEA